MAFANNIEQQGQPCEALDSSCALEWCLYPSGDVKDASPSDEAVIEVQTSQGDRAIWWVALSDLFRLDLMITGKNYPEGVKQVWISW